VAKVVHDPRLDTILMVEKAIQDFPSYPKKMELWRSLPKKMQYQTFKRVLDYFEASGKIIYNSSEIIYTGGNNPKLKEMIRTAVKL